MTVYASWFYINNLLDKLIMLVSHYDLICQIYHPLKNHYNYQIKTSLMIYNHVARKRLYILNNLILNLVLDADLFFEIFPYFVLISLETTI